MIEQVHGKYGYMMKCGGREEVSELFKRFLTKLQRGNLQEPHLLSRELLILLQQVGHRDVQMDQGFQLGIMKTALSAKHQAIISQAFKENPRLTADEAFREIERKSDGESKKPADGGASAMQTYDDYTGSCFICGSFEHFKESCPERKRRDGDGDSGGGAAQGDDDDDCFI